MWVLILLRGFQYFKMKWKKAPNFKNYMFRISLTRKKFRQENTLTRPPIRITLLFSNLTQTIIFLQCVVRLTEELLKAIPPAC